MLEPAVDAWHTAVNTGDRQAAMAAVTDPVDVSGPRGAGPIPASAFADWIIQSGIRLRPLSAHPVAADVVVVEQEASWPSTGEAAPPVTVATVFAVRDGVVRLTHRYDDVHDALRAARHLTPGP